MKHDMEEVYTAKQLLNQVYMRAKWACVRILNSNVYKWCEYVHFDISATFHFRGILLHWRNSILENLYSITYLTCELVECLGRDQSEVSPLLRIIFDEITSQLKWHQFIFIILIIEFTVKTSCNADLTFISIIISMAFGIFCTKSVLA